MSGPFINAGAGELLRCCRCRCRACSSLSAHERNKVKGAGNAGRLLWRTRESGGGGAANRLREPAPKESSSHLRQPPGTATAATHKGSGDHRTAAGGTWSGRTKSLSGDARALPALRRRLLWPRTAPTDRLGRATHQARLSSRGRLSSPNASPALLRPELAESREGCGWGKSPATHSTGWSGFGDRKFEGWGGRETRARALFLGNNGSQAQHTKQKGRRG